MKEWKTYRIGDICKTNSSQYSPKEAWDEFLYLDTGNITRNIIEDIVRYSSAAELPSRARRKVVNDDIIFSTVRPNQCHFGILSNPPANLLVSTGFTVITANTKIVDPYYLYYYLTQDSIVDYLHSIGEQAVSAYPSIKAQDIEDIEIELPDLSTQNNIAKTLRALDNKIQLNRQINDNLEQQAQALYKSWFIDNYQTEWPEYSLDEVTLKITDGVHNTVIDTPNGEYYLLSCKNIKNRRLNMSSSDRRIDEGTFNKLRKRTMLSKGDILLSSVGTIGELMLLNDDPHNYEFQRSVAIIKPNPVYISSYYLYETLISQIDKITNTAHGAVQQCIFLSDLKEYTINIADKALISRYDIIVKPFFDEITKREKEIARLTSLRDSLLPKLMSGELKINEIDC